MPNYSANHILVIFAISSTAACSNPDGSTGRVGSPYWFNSTTPEMRYEYFSKICKDYGFEAGTTEMSQCVQQETVAARDNSNQKAQISGAAYANTYSAVTSN
ncbi:hypothetical protein SuNHUV7_07100 (plasmid) [Pseudoseohaeicola sp. NH-UV-7]|uniref:hypothetical protein n=1 Tax=Sulfitobacter sp. TBRI5 TaxID=2989732 RepID=UPI003A6B6391